MQKHTCKLQLIFCDNPRSYRCTITLLLAYDQWEEGEQEEKRRPHFTMCLLDSFRNISIQKQTWDSMRNRFCLSIKIYPTFFVSYSAMFSVKACFPLLKGASILKWQVIAMKGRTLCTKISSIYKLTILISMFQNVLSNENIDQAKCVCLVDASKNKLIKKL